VGTASRRARGYQLDNAGIKRMRASSVSKSTVR
jgi:hypothetical protein